MEVAICLAKYLAAFVYKKNRCKCVFNQITRKKLIKNINKAYVNVSGN